MALAIVVLLASVAASSAADDDLKIQGPADGLTSVEVYGDIEAETLSGSLASEAFPLPVYGISENLMIYVKTADVEGWVFPFHVKANFQVNDIGPCNYNISTGEAAPRAIGRNCKNAND